MVFIPEGETDPDCNDPQRRNDPGCAVIGTFGWGETTALTIGLGGSTPVFQSAGPAATTHPGRLKFGVTLDYNWYHGFSSVVGDQPDIQTFSGDDTPFGGGVFVEVSPRANAPYFIGTALRYNRHRVSQTYGSNNPLIPGSVTGSVDAFFVDVYGGVSIPMRNTTVNLLGGGVISYDVFDFTSSWDGGSEEDTRTHTGFMGRFGGNVATPLTGSTCAILGADYTTAFQSGDADAHGRAYAGVSLHGMRFGF